MEPKVFIDWVALLLVNMSAGYGLLAWFVASGVDDQDTARWAPAFAGCGLVALVFGGIMTVTWPLPGPYGAAFGDMSVLFGTIFLAAGLAMAKGWSLLPVALYAFFPGLAAVILGLRFWVLSLTLWPVLSSIGFLLSGLAGILAAPALAYAKDQRLRVAITFVLAVTAVIWAINGYLGYWSHMQGFAHWVPEVLRQAAPAPLTMH